LGFLGTIWECKLGGLSGEKEQRFPGRSGNRGLGRRTPGTGNQKTIILSVTRKTEGLTNTKEVKENGAIKQKINDVI
jgi:hypothetical protein